MWDKVVIQATPILILTQKMLKISELERYNPTHMCTLHPPYTRGMKRKTLPN
jgi:hypothetical protein